VNPAVTARADELRRSRLAFVHARVVRAERPTSARPGDEAVILPDGTIEGFVGGVCAEATVRAQSLSLLDSGDSLLLRILPEGDLPAGEDRSAGALTVVNPCLSGGTLEIFLEPVVPAPALAVVGESPIALALAELAPRVGFQVAPGDAVLGDVVALVVASHGRGEEDTLVAALDAGVPYVGLVASPKRGAAVVAGLPVDGARRAAVHTPAGLDIGARTPAEVALSILAEIVSLRPRPTSALGSTTGGPERLGEQDSGPPPTRHLGVLAARTVTDRVCGMSVVADDEALHLDHEGERYWFCGTGCLRAFAADPGAYLS
jgi:xanthine dehydrogenase accessory factor